MARQARAHPGRPQRPQRLVRQMNFMAGQDWRYLVRAFSDTSNTDACAPQTATRAIYERAVKTVTNWAPAAADCLLQIIQSREPG